MSTTAQAFAQATAAHGEATAIRPLAPPLERRRLQTYLGLMLADAAMIVIGFMAAGFIYLGDPRDPGSLTAAQLILPLFWTFALNNRAYSIDALISAGFGMRKAVAALLLATIVVLFVAFLAKAGESFSRAGFTLGVLISLVLLVWVRDTLRDFVHWRVGAVPRNLLVIEDGGAPVEIADAIRIDAQAHQLVPDIANPHALNRLGLYLRNIDRVIVSCPAARRSAWAMALKGANIDGEVVDNQVVELGVLGARRGAGFGSLIISTGSLGIRSRAMKRILDIAVAGGAVLVLSPLLLLVAALIKLGDGGPVLFVQRRMGRSNRFFKIYKFRSMRAEHSDSEGKRSTGREDDRITRLGRIIRATSIDELPQLFNVIKGEMSIVGPRPHALGSLAGDKMFWEVDARYSQRHSLKPGLTGLAQVRGLRGATALEADLTNRLQSDLEYLDGWTIWRDITIIAATLKVVIHRNAF